MNTTITINVPLNAADLLKASDQLGELAEFLSASDTVTLDKPTQPLHLVTNNGNDTGVQLHTLETPATPMDESVELDSTGIPWDNRIHASTKTKTAAGVWKRRKGVDDGTFNKVTAELKAVMAIPVAPGGAGGVSDVGNIIVTQEPPTPPAPPAPPTPVANVSDDDEFIVDGNIYTRGQLLGHGWQEESIIKLPRPEPAIPAPPTPPAPPAPAGLTFPAFIKKVTEAINNGTLTQKDVDDVVNAKGFASVALLAARPDQIPDVNKALFS